MAKTVHSSPKVCSSSLLHSGNWKVVGQTVIQFPRLSDTPWSGVGSSGQWNRDQSHKWYLKSGPWTPPSQHCLQTFPHSADYTGDNPQGDLINIINLGSWVNSWNRAIPCTYTGLPDGTSGKKSACHCRRCKRPGFDPWGGKIPLEKEMAIHSSILAWEIPWTEEPGRLQITGLQSQTQLSTHACITYIHTLSMWLNRHVWAPLSLF